MNRRRRYYHAAEKRNEPHRSIVNRRIPDEEKNSQRHGPEPETGRDPKGEAGAGPGGTIHIGEGLSDDGLSDTGDAGLYRVPFYVQNSPLYGIP